MSTYDPAIHGERRAPSSESWHVKKEFSLSLILTVIVQVIAFVWFLATIREEIALIKADLVVLHQRDTQITGDFQTIVRELKDSIKELNAKMDRVIERGSKP